MLHARPIDPPRVQGRLLVLVCGYRGGVGNAAPFSIAAWAPSLGFAGRLLDRLTWISLRRFIARNRDFAANPRDLRYQAGLTRDLVSLGQPGEVVCVVDETIAASPDVDELASIGRVERRPAATMADGAGTFDTVALVYPDALGLGWRPLEKQVARCKNVVFVNGRRRVMSLRGAERRALAFRRLLAVTRVPELAFALAVIPLAALCAAIDVLRGRS